MTKLENSWPEGELPRRDLRDSMTVCVGFDPGQDESWDPDEFPHGPVTEPSTPSSPVEPPPADPKKIPERDAA